MIKILHSVDLELSKDIPETIQALDQVLEIAKRKKIDILTIAGKLFNSKLDADILRIDLKEKFSKNEFDILILPSIDNLSMYQKGYDLGTNVRLMTDKPYGVYLQDCVKILTIPNFENTLIDLSNLKKEISKKEINIILFNISRSFDFHGIYTIQEIKFILTNNRPGNNYETARAVIFIDLYLDRKIVIPIDFFYTEIYINEINKISKLKKSGIVGVDVLLLDLKSNVNSVRHQAVKKIGLYHKESVEDINSILMKLAKDDPIGYVRAEIIDLLTELKVKECIPLLIDRLLNDNTRIVQKSARLNLYKFDTLSEEEYNSITQALNSAIERETDTYYIKENIDLLYFLTTKNTNSIEEFLKLAIKINEINTLKFAHNAITNYDSLDKLTHEIRKLRLEILRNIRNLNQKKRRIIKKEKMIAEKIERKEIVNRLRIPQKHNPYLSKDVTELFELLESDSSEELGLEILFRIYANEISDWNELFNLIFDYEFNLDNNLGDALLEFQIIYETKIYVSSQIEFSLHTFLSHIKSKKMEKKGYKELISLFLENLEIFIRYPEKWENWREIDLILLILGELEDKSLIKYCKAILGFTSKQLEELIEASNMLSNNEIDNWDIDLKRTATLILKKMEK